MKAKEESAYVKLARETIENYIKHGKIITPPLDLPKEMINQKAGVFVSIKKFGNLRGCIGTFMPTQENIAQEIIKNAISAAVDDPRFSPVTVSELGNLIISVDVLSPPEEISDILELDPKKYGVIVSSGYKKGLLLPDLEGRFPAYSKLDKSKSYIKCNMLVFIITIYNTICCYILTSIFLTRY